MAALPSVWAQRKRFIANDRTRESMPWSFTTREWQRTIMDDLSPRVVIEKAAQMGLTEVSMTRAMHSVDARGIDVLYLFPTESAASDFSAARFDPMLDESPDLRRVFSDVSNVGLKRAGPTNLYLRGSNSRTSIKSIPVGGLVLDEFDEMVQESVVLVRKRLLAQREPWELNLSTPRYPGVGIDAEYQDSDMHQWWMPCPKCGVFQVLELEPNLIVPGEWEVEGAHWQCAECREPWSEAERVSILDRGQWRPSRPGASLRGYHISQLFSPVTTAPRIAREWRESRKSASHEEDFYNSMLGLPYEAASVKLSRSVIESCMGGFEQVSRSSVPVAVGIDVGSVNHFIVAAMVNGRPRVLKIGHTDWAGCDMLMHAFRPECVIIDANPERHKATEFRARWGEGLVFLAFYPDSDHMQGQEVLWDDELGNVKIHRTALGDRVAGRLLRQEFALPCDTPREAVRHLSSVYRTTEEQANGKVRAKWHARGPDHLFHAAIYLETALERVDDGGEWSSSGDGLGEDDDGAWVSQDSGGFPTMDEGW